MDSPTSENTIFSKIKKTLGVLFVILIVLATSSWFVYDRYIKPLADTFTKASSNVNRDALIQEYNKQVANGYYVSAITDGKPVYSEVTKIIPPGFYLQALAEPGSIDAPGRNTLMSPITTSIPLDFYVSALPTIGSVPNKSLGRDTQFSRITKIPMAGHYVTRLSIEGSVENEFLGSNIMFEAITTNIPNGCYISEAAIAGDSHNLGRNTVFLSKLNIIPKGFYVSSIGSSGTSTKVGQNIQLIEIPQIPTDSYVSKIGSIGSINAMGYLCEVKKFEPIPSGYYVSKPGKNGDFSNIGSNYELTKFPVIPFENYVVKEGKVGSFTAVGENYLSQPYTPIGMPPSSDYYLDENYKSSGTYLTKGRDRYRKYANLGRVEPSYGSCPDGYVYNSDVSQTSCGVPICYNDDKTVLKFSCPEGTEPVYKDKCDFPSEWECLPVATPTPTFTI